MNEIDMKIVKAFLQFLGLVDRKCPHCLWVKQYKEYEDSKEILVYRCSHCKRYHV